VLDYNKRVYKNQCRYQSLLVTASFVGGFFLGLAVQGWTIEKLEKHPIVLVVLLILATGFYFLSKTKSFKSLHRLLNPGYIKAKKQLEDQLRVLESQE